MSGTPHESDEVPQPGRADTGFSQEDDIPYVVPPLKIAFTIKVRVKELGKLPAMPYPIDERDVTIGDG